MEHSRMKSPCFNAALGLVAFPLLAAVTLPFTEPRLGLMSAGFICIGAALPVAVLALISRLRGEPAKLRSFFLMGLMVIYMIFMLVEMFSAD